MTRTSAEKELELPPGTAPAVILVEPQLAEISA